MVLKVFWKPQPNQVLPIPMAIVVGRGLGYESYAVLWNYNLLPSNSTGLGTYQLRILALDQNGRRLGAFPKSDDNFTPELIDYLF